MAANDISEIRIDKDGDLLFCTVGLYKLFLSQVGGHDAFSLYMHLMFTARLQETNQVWAKNTYLKKGLGMGEKKVKKAKALLQELGLTSYVRNRKADGTLGEVYIKLNFTTREPTTGSVNHRVKKPPSGDKRQMLKVKKLNALSEEKKEETALPTAAVDLPAESIHKRIRLLFEQLHGKQFTNYGKEGASIKALIDIVKRLHPDKDPETVINFMAGCLKELKDTRREKYWREVLISPSTLLSRWDQVYDIARETHKQNNDWRTMKGALA